MNCHRLLISIFAFLLFACGQTNRSDQKDGAQLAEENETEVRNRFLFIHSETVSDFDSWLINFKNDDYKLYQDVFDSLNIYQSYDDENLVFISGEFTIEEDGRIFLANRQKEAQFYRLIEIGEDIPQASNRFFVYQDVGDYITWQEKFEEDESKRRANGMYCLGIARNLDSPTKLVNYFSVTDLETALGFINPELTKTIESASVVGQPVLQILRSVEVD